MRHLISQFILDKYAAGELRGSVPAAAVFVDVSGFSALTETLSRQGDLGAEFLAEVMRVLFAPLVEAVHSQGGFVVGYAGDAFTAIFPGQAGDPSCAERALSAALQMQDHLRANPVIQTEFGGFPISIKAGLGYGEVSWLIIKDSSGMRATYCVRGSCVDGAVSAEGVAAKSEIILDPAAFAILKEQIEATCAAAGCRVDAVKGNLPAPQPFDLPLVQAELLSDFYPVSLIRQELTGEFRQVVNVFIDIPMKPTEESFVTPFMESLFALQRRYGGFFLRPDMGDKGFNILMVWGAPTAHENDIDRALNFVLDLTEQTGVPFRAGITYKPAYAGFIGTQLREDYTAYGWGVNLASRMMEAAGPGEIWLDEEVVKRASLRFQMEDLGNRNFKGFGGRIKTYRLRNRKQLVELTYRGNLVGRKAELDRLIKFLSPIRNGLFAGLLVVRGEAGIGKSRLIYEVQAEALEGKDSAEWVTCQSDEIVGDPFRPFKNWLRDYFGISEEQDRASNEAAFESSLHLLADLPNDPELAAEILRTASVLAALVNLERPGSLYEQLDAKGRHDNTLLALGAVLRAIAVKKNLVLLVEDLQWLDEESRLFLVYFIRSLRTDPDHQYPVAILITSRSDLRFQELDNLTGVEYMELEPLGAGNLSELGQSLLGGMPAPELVRLLESRSDGNPFFAEQILRYLMEKNLIVCGEDGLCRERESSQERIPTDVQAVLIARLDRLSREIREVVQTASVLGREFEIRLLAAMLKGDDRLIQKVLSAEESEIWFPLNEMEYIFRHGLLRDAAYGMQLLTRQRELHVLAVNAMEMLYSDDLSGHLGELAYHAERANLTSRAYDYLLRAAKAAADAYHNLPAQDYLSRALALTPADDISGAFDLLEKRLEIYSRTGDRAGQIKDLNRLDELARSLGDSGHAARTAGQWSNYHFVMGNYPEAIRFAQHAVTLGREAGELEAALVAYNSWAVGLLRQAELKPAMAVAMEALDLARQSKKKYFQGLTLNSIGIIAHLQEDPDTAEKHLEEAARIARETGDRALLAKVNANLGNVAGSLRGDYAAARRYYEQSLASLEEQGDRYGQAVSLLNLAWAAGMEGDFSASRAYNMKSLSYAREVGNPHYEAFALINLSAVASIQGDVATAKESAGLAVDLTRRLGDRIGESWGLLNLGHAYLAAGETDEATAQYEQSMNIRLELDQPGFYLEPLAGLIQVALQQGDLNSALEHTERILTHLAQGGTLESAEEPLRIYLACYQTLIRIKDNRARDLLEEAVRLLDSQAARLPDEAARQRFLNSVPWRRAIHQARANEI